MANFDAGNFNLNFGQIGGPNRFPKAPGPNQNKPAEQRVEDKGPRDGVDISSLPMLQVNPEILPADPINDTPIIAGGLSSLSGVEPTFSPSGIIDLNAIGSLEAKKFSNVGVGLTAVNGLNSTSIFSLSGSTIASVNPFSPVSATRMPTTSVSTNGIEDTAWVTSSGRVVSLDGPSVVKMPTTSVTSFGLEDSEWLTTSGRRIAL